MVSLTERIGYNCTIEDKPKITCFNSFIKGEAVSHMVPDGTNDTDKVYFASLQSISNNQKEEFFKVFQDFSRRKPSTENAWIHNEFLIFTLICGIEKYQIDKTWINEVIEVRSTGNKQYLAINKTFKNILSGNTQSTDNVSEIVIVFLDILNQPQLPKEILDKTYLTISNNTGLMNTKDDFLITMSFRAFDVILLSKDTPDAIEIAKLRDFRTIFLGRVKIATEVVYYLLLLAFIVAVIKYSHRYQSFKDYVTDLGAVFQLGGLAFLAAFRWIKKQIKVLLLRTFGYYRLFNKTEK